MRILNLLAENPAAPPTRTLLRRACIATPCLLLAATHCPGVPSAPTAAPNIILILTDDLGVDDSGIYSNPIVRTPNLNAFAAQSALFTRFYASPICSPSRAGLMTGRYHFRTGVIDTGDGRSNMRTEEITLAEMLRERGYRTGIFGKWHLGDNAPFRAMDQGFDESIVFVGGMIGTAYNPLGGASYFDPVLLRNGHEERFPGYVTDILTDNAIDFIKQDKERGRPFFLYLAYNAPHHPLTAPEDDIKPYRDAGLSDETSRFYGMISNLDKNIGRLLGELDRLSLDKNTIVIFMSDNGTSSLLKEKDRYQSGLRGYKSFMYENGIRVPFCIRWPDRIEAGRTIDTVSAHLDVFPTLRDMCDTATPAPRASDCKQSAPQLDGLSLWPLLSGKDATLPERKLFFQWHRGDNPRLYRNTAVLAHPLKLVQPVGRNANDENKPHRFELYNLKTDAFEKNDIAAENIQIVSNLKTADAAWFASMGLIANEIDGTAPYELAIPYVGTELENPVRFTRQDWRGAKDSEWGDATEGWWQFDVRAPGRYEITLWFSDVLAEDGIVHLKINDTERTTTMTAAECAVRLSSIQLSTGKTTLAAWVQLPKERKSVRYVDIRRTDIPNSIKPFMQR